MRSALWFRGGLPGKARDFNWHNVLGFWSAIPLAIVVASGAIISYPWASNLVYRAAGETPPAPASRGGGPGGPAARAGDRGRQGGPGSRPDVSTPTPRHVGNLDVVVAAAVQTQPNGRSIAVALPAEPTAPVVLNIDTGDGGQPQKRATLTFDRERGSITRAEMFSDQSQGRRWRSLLRFAHTGEVLGIVGQTVAGLVSAASLVMAYTGWALAWRRLVAWRRRRASRRSPEQSSEPQPEELVAQTEV